MPYLEFLKCEKCGQELDIDHGATIRAYYAEGRAEKDVWINSATVIWDYLIYACYRCNSTHKYTFREVELRVRKYFSEMTQKHRVIFDRLDVIDFDGWGRLVLPTKEEYRAATVSRLDKAYKKD